MRPLLILATVILMIGALAYALVRDAGDSQQPAVVAPQAAESSRIQQPLAHESLISTLHDLEHRALEQWRQVKAEHARLNRRLIELDERLRSLESFSTGLSPDATEDASEGEAAGENRQSGKITTLGLGQWMDAALRNGYRDEEASKLATDQTLASVAILPNFELDELHCGEAFCRATFYQEGGNEQAIRDLFGHPPFINEGFTLQEPDGRISLYFTQPGVSLADLRSEARAAASLDADW